MTQHELRRALLVPSLERRVDAAFVPHVTLLRKLLHPGKLPVLVPQEWQAEEFALVRSWRSDRGPAYETVARWPLHLATQPA